MENEAPNPTHLAQLAQKIAGVMQDVQHVPKNGFNKEFNYRFVSEPDALDAVRTAALRHGLVILPSVLSVVQEPTGQSTGRGAPVYRTRVTMQYDLVDTETGYARSSTWSGESMEAQDKGINKAIVSAGKYFLLKTFLIPSGDDPDASTLGRRAGAANGEAPAPSRAPVNNLKAIHAGFGLTAEQDAELKEACKRQGMKFSDFLLRAHEEGARTFDDLRARLDGAKTNGALVA